MSKWTNLINSTDIKRIKAQFPFLSLFSLGHGECLESVGQANWKPLFWGKGRLSSAIPQQRNQLPYPNYRAPTVLKRCWRWKVLVYIYISSSFVALLFISVLLTALILLQDWSNGHTQKSSYHILASDVAVQTMNTSTKKKAQKELNEVSKILALVFGVSSVEAVKVRITQGVWCSIQASTSFLP